MLKINLTKTDITPEESVPLQGYGDRTHGSVGVHDPLYAYVWFVKSNTARRGKLWIVLDLCLLSVKTAFDLRKALTAETGLRPEEISISTTHTHSGPNARFLSDDPDPWAPRYYSLLISRLSQGIRDAERQAFEGTLEVRLGSMRLGVNRRGEALSIDPRIVLLTLKDRQGRARGHLFHYSCHPTALGVDNYLISSDWVGPVRESFERRFSVPVGFIQGAEGNIDPVCRGVLHMEDPDQAMGVSFEQMEQTAGLAVTALEETFARDCEAVLDALEVDSFDASLPLRFGGLGRQDIEDQIQQWKGEFSRFLEVPAQEVPEDYSINARIKEKCRKHNLPPETVLEWVSRQFTYCAFISIYRRGEELVDPAKGEMRIPVSIWDFGRLFFVGIPAEVLVEIAFHLQKRFPKSIALIAGLFDGWVGYLPHGDNFAEERQAFLYETVSTMFADQAAGALLDLVEARRC